MENICDPINTDAWEDTPFISIDGDTLYFSSRRDGGYDNIYFSVKRPTAVKDNDELHNNEINNINVSPNPFNSQISVKITINETSPFNVKNYNILGQEFYSDRLLFNEGINVFKWPNNSPKNSEVPSGIYFMDIFNASNTYKTKFTKIK